MKKRSLSKFALLGITSGLLITVQSPGTILAGHLSEKRQGPEQGSPGATPSKPRTQQTAYYKKKTSTPEVAEADKPKTAKVPKSEAEIEKLKAQNSTYHLMTEDELLPLLNDKARELFESMDPETKALALKIASQACGGSNDCKNQNACATEEHDCAGKGNCKGEGKCGMSDKNLAVKIAAKVMAEKRAKAVNGSNGN